MATHQCCWHHERAAHSREAVCGLQGWRGSIVEVAFGANVEADVELLKEGGSIAIYATNAAAPNILFWTTVLKKITLFFRGSDDFPIEAKIQAARDLNRALEAR